MKQGSIVIQAKVSPHPEYINYRFFLCGCHAKKIVFYACNIRKNKTNPTFDPPEK
jgi:hypothetical protein